MSDRSSGPSELFCLFSLLTGCDVVAGQDSMFMLDPANFGTPLSMLQIPARSIQRIQEKLSDADCAVTYYSQDCRHFSDLRKAVASDDWTLARRATVDVGYICRRCHIVYPGRTACASHQDVQCYRDGSAPNNAIVKLEQIQYECAACRVKTSTIVEYKSHCAADSHRKAAAAWIRVHTATSTQSAIPRSESAIDAAQTSPTPVQAAVYSRPPSTNQQSRPDEDPAVVP